jgi:tetratricopeptide (TPR) repeat protein
MTDEITSALAKVPNLRVVGRSSAFQFKDQSKDLRAIGEALSATYLIDGSVRRAGNRVRVTAQLVKANDGINLWTDSYDRELTDVFAIEEDIAQAIAAALRAPLGLAEGERLVSNRTTDVESYQDYLRGRSLVRGRIVDEAIATLESAVARDPNFAPAWSMLSQAYRSLLDYCAVARRKVVAFEEARIFVQSALDRGERAARRAIELDPRHDGGHAALATILATRGEWLGADDLFAQAFAIDPNNPEALYRYGQMLNIVGRVADSLRTYEQLRMLEPLVPIYQFQAGSQMYIAGRNQTAIAILEGTPDDSPARFYRNLLSRQDLRGGGPVRRLRRRGPRAARGAAGQPRGDRSRGCIDPHAGSRRIAGELARSWRSQLCLRLRRCREPSHGACRARLEDGQRHHAIDFLGPCVGARAPNAGVQDVRARSGPRRLLAATRLAGSLQPTGRHRFRLRLTRRHRAKKSPAQGRAN